MHTCSYMRRQKTFIQSRMIGPYRTFAYMLIHCGATCCQGCESFLNNKKGNTFLKKKSTKSASSSTSSKTRTPTPYSRTSRLCADRRHVRCACGPGSCRICGRIAQHHTPCPWLQTATPRHPGQMKPRTDRAGCARSIGAGCRAYIVLQRESAALLLSCACDELNHARQWTG